MEQFFAQHSLLITLATLWTLPWKGISLWKSAKRGDLKWFIALLIINTLGILEILYIYVFSERKHKENPVSG